jgi:oxygen-independent coproporphyrinogen-3 oxidase
LAGIYIHIPFCRRKCHYCNFFSLASQKLKEPFLQALNKEISATREYLAHEPVNTIYFGGGTPSLYDPRLLQEIIDLIRLQGSAVARLHGTDAFPATPSSAPGLHDTDAFQATPSGAITSSKAGHGPGSSCEITLELNPDDVTSAFIGQLKQTSFNRFSIGIQSFHDSDLACLNRSHSASQAIGSVRLLQEAGYGNLSIDLIYGIPSSTNDQWLRNLETAFSLDVPHISGYALTIEPKTPLAWMIGKQRSEPVNDELQVQQFRMLMEQTKQNGYEQYEISNFSLPGQHARHNTNYWKGIPYLGLGPSAHSYNGTSRRWNLANLTKYIASVEKGECIYEEEVLTPAQKYNEYVMTSLRTMWGCDEKRILDFGFTIYDFFRKNTAPMIGKGFLREASGIYYLTEEGKLFADRIASELFLTD